MIRTESPLWRDATFSNRIKASHYGSQYDDFIGGPGARKLSRSSTLPLSTSLTSSVNGSNMSRTGSVGNNKSVTSTRKSSSKPNGVDEPDLEQKVEVEKPVEKEITDEEWIQQLGKKLQKPMKQKKDHIEGILDYYHGERTEKLIRHGLGLERSTTWKLISFLMNCRWVDEIHVEVKNDI